MESKKPIKKQVVAYMNVLHLWFMENDLFLSEDLGIPIEKLDYTSNFFSRLLSSKELPPGTARTLSNLFQGKGSPESQYVLTILEDIVKAFEIDVHKYQNKFLFDSYKDIRDRKLRLNEKYLSDKYAPNSGDYSKIQIDFLNNGDEIYNTVLELILENTESSIKAVMNGGLGGKAPENWHREIYAFLKERHLSSSPVTFDLVIVCKEEDFQNKQDIQYMKDNIRILKKLGIENRFRVHLCIQNHVWASPDFIMIDRDYLIFNWPTTLNKVTAADRTQKAFLISNSFAAIQYYKDFFENIILAEGKCILAEDYLREKGL